MTLRERNLLPHPPTKTLAHTQIRRNVDHPTQTITYEVQYHATTVLHAYVNLSQNLIHFTIQTNCYHTPTTKSRINLVLRCFSVPHHVFQKSYTWYIHNPNGPPIPLEEPHTFSVRIPPTDLTHYHTLMEVHS